jgi:hypothetical protein
MRRSATLGAVLAALILAGSSSSTPQSGEQPYSVDTGPVWSADGSRIAFLRNNSGNWSVRAVAATGGPVELLGALPSEPPEREWTPKLSPDWSKAAYGGGAGLKIVKVDGTGSSELAMTPLHIAWSPDSRFLAIAAGISAEVYVVRADGSDLHKVADGLSSAWSPDASQLLVVLPYSTRLAIVSRDGSGYREIWRSTYGVGTPSWAPTGDKIAFWSDGAIQVVRPDGTPIRTFTKAFGGSPTWSFDGAKIAITSGNGLSVLDVGDGSERRFPFAHEASWAPNAHLFAAAMTNGCSFAGIHVASTTSGAVRRLTLGCRILGSRRGELLEGTDWTDVILGRRGDDRISGFGSDDRLFGGPGNDRITGGPYAEDDADVVDGGPGNDVLDGGRAQQSEYSARDDLLLGRSGSDFLRGGPGRDTLDGGTGNDTIHARDGESDWIRCGAGRDVALVDKLDHLSRGCEVVLRPRKAAR